MTRLLLTLTLTLAPSAALAYFGQPQTNVATTILTATTANVDCDSSTDAVKNGTATPSCTNTGSILTEGWSQITIPIRITYAASTTLTMQCDTSSDAVTWSVVPKVTPDGVSTARSWTHAFTTAGNVAFTFNAQAKYTRCRFWFSIFNSGNKIAVPTVRLASILPR
jgi:hypothetical protein